MGGAGGLHAAALRRPPRHLAVSLRRWGPTSTQPLFFGLRAVRDLLGDEQRKGLDEALVGSIDWYMRRNFAYVYRGTIVHSIEWGEHALSFFVPRCCGRTRSRASRPISSAYDRLHQDYLYNPDHYLRFGGRPIVYYQSAFKWSTWVPWLCEHRAQRQLLPKPFPAVR
jgi:hypothetical protein